MKKEIIFKKVIQISVFSSFVGLGLSNLHAMNLFEDVGDYKVTNSQWKVAALVKPETDLLSGRAVFGHSILAFIGKENNEHLLWAADFGAAKGKAHGTIWTDNGYIRTTEDNDRGLLKELEQRNYKNWSFVSWKIDKQKALEVIQEIKNEKNDINNKLPHYNLFEQPIGAYFCSKYTYNCSGWVNEKLKRCGIHAPGTWFSNILASIPGMEVAWQYGSNSSLQCVITPSQTSNSVNIRPFYSHKFLPEFSNINHNYIEEGCYILKNRDLARCASTSDGYLTWTALESKHGHPYAQSLSRLQATESNYYSQSGYYRKSVLWDVSRTENGNFIIRNRDLGGATLALTDEQSPCGNYVEIIRNYNPYVSRRENVLWKLSRAENGAFIIQSGNLCHGYLTWSVDSKNGKYIQTVDFPDDYEKYLPGKPYRNSILWDLIRTTY